MIMIGRQRMAFILFIALSLFVVSPTLAQVISSASYQVVGGHVQPLSGTPGSSSFGVRASGFPITGDAAQSSASFRANIWAGATVSQSSSGGSTGSSSGGFTYPSTIGTTTIIRNIRVTSVDTETVEITFDTDDVAATFVSFGPGSIVARTDEEASFLLSHRFRLIGLTPGTEYLFTIDAREPTGEAQTTTPFTFVTDSDLVIVPNVTNLQAVRTGNTADLSWVNPSASFDRVVIVRQTGRYPTSPTDGEQIFVGTGAETQDRGLIDDQSYYYAAFVLDAAGNWSSGALAFVDALSVESTPTDTASEPSSPQPTPPTLDPSESSATTEPSPVDPPEDPTQEDLPIPTTPDVTVPLPPVTEVLPEIPPPPSSESIFADSEITANIGDYLRSVITVTFSSEGEDYTVTSPLDPLPNVASLRSVDGASVLVRVADDAFPVTPVLMTIQIGESNYQFAYNTASGQYEVALETNYLPGLRDVTVRALFANGDVVTHQDALLIERQGTASIDAYKPWSWRKPWQWFTREDVTLAETQVVLMSTAPDGTSVVWEDPQLRQPNPVVTNIEGQFVFVVPPGTYDVVAMSAAYGEVRLDQLAVTGQIVNPVLTDQQRDLRWLFAIIMGLMGVLIAAAGVRSIRSRKKQ